MAGPMSGLTARAVRRGLLGGQKSWRMVLVAIGIVRLFRLLSSSRPHVLRETLEPGEALEVRNLLGGSSDRDA